MQHQVIDDALQHHMLRADTAASACLDRAKHQKLYSVAALCILIRDIIHLRIQSENLIKLICSGPLLHQLSHFGDRNNRVQLLF